MPAERQNVVLVYPASRVRDRVLMQFHKNPMDPSYNRYNGISEFPRKHESLAEAARRALRKAGILEADLTFRGTVHWSRFDPNDWPLFGHLFLADIPESSAIVLEDEDVRRRWLQVDEILGEQVPCWPGDLAILPLVLDNNPRPFQGIMIYDQGLPREWRYDRT